jgi:hypothetical protein
MTDASAGSESSGIAIPPLLYLRRWVFGLAALGLLWRVVLYLVGRPIWGDEAALGLNIVGRTYAELLAPLDHDQVAPILFLWLERAASDLLGLSEYAMRLVPLLAGIAALVVTARWARAVAEPLTASLTIALVAVSYFCTRHTVELKPYGFDLLATATLLLFATRFLTSRRAADLVLLTVATPLALGASHPAVFTAAGIATALLLVMKEEPTRTRVAYAAFVAVLAASFLGWFVLVTRGQYDRTAPFMVEFWRPAFPPAKPWPFLAWILDVHTGSLLAYPVGGPNAGSVVSFVLFAIGLVAWVRVRPRVATVLLLAPFALTFVAAALHRYPYGYSARVAQHLVPAIVLLVATGIVQVVRWASRSAIDVHRGAAIAFCVLGVIGIGGLVRTVVRPYKDEGDRPTRSEVRTFLSRVGPGQPIVSLSPLTTFSYKVRWYLAEGHATVRAMGPHDLGEWRAPSADLWVINARDDTVTREGVARTGRPVLDHRRVMLEVKRDGSSLSFWEWFHLGPPVRHGDE